MAGNFWLSSHYHQWILTAEEILMDRQQDLKHLTNEEYQKLMIFFCRFIQSLGEQLKLRQQVIATGTIYFRRFYARNSLKCIDPLLLVPTCLFLAAKVEECGVITNAKLINACTTVLKSKFAFAFPTVQEYPYRINQIFFSLIQVLKYILIMVKETKFLTMEVVACKWEKLMSNDSLNKWRVLEIKEFVILQRLIEEDYIWECEFYILEAMDCSLIVFHPYRSLTKYLADMGQEDALLPIAWRIVNDSLRTDACLMYPPYLLSLTAIYMACVSQQKDCDQWFAELNVDMEKVMEITQKLLALYELWKNYDEKKEVCSILVKMPKPRSGQSSRPSSTTPRNHTPSPVPGLH